MAAVDDGVLRAQIFSVPENGRQKLVHAIAADLDLWVGRFITAADEADLPAMSKALHALRGICAGFGANALCEAVSTARATFEAAGHCDTRQVKAMLAETLFEISNISLTPDRRQARG